MAWQYAQLVVIEDSRPTSGLKTTRSVTWQGPAPGLSEENICSDATLLQLMNRFGADGWELAAVHEHQEGVPGGRNWDAPWSRVTYTFKKQTR
jgi:hypothetical protein